MNDLDANNDGEVDFTEFIILMGALTVACNDFFLEFKTDDKPKDGESAQKKDWNTAKEGGGGARKVRWRGRKRTVNQQRR